MKSPVYDYFRAQFNIYLKNLFYKSVAAISLCLKFF
jgi:hypothetical protein